MEQRVPPYPLHWPVGWPRTKARSHGNLAQRSSFGAVRDGLCRELERLGAREVILSTNMEVRLDGLPSASARRPADPGVAVYFNLDGKPHVLACDRWWSVVANMRAIAKHIEALRGIERWGVGSIERAFSAYKALPPAAGDRHLPWREVLGFEEEDEPITREKVREAFKHYAKVCHPDTRDGSHEAFTELTRARDEALGELES